MSSQVKRVVLVGIDGLQLGQMLRFVEEGVLPNFKQLLARGSAGEFLPEIPAWTPTNWGTIATGALPGSTMLSGWMRRHHDDLTGEKDLSTFSSQACPVETIWEAAERAGLRTLAVFHPLTWPPRAGNGMVVAPLYSGTGLAPLDISKGRVWTTRADRVPDGKAINVTADGDAFCAKVEISPSAAELAKQFNYGDKPSEAREQVKAGRQVRVRLIFEPTARRARVADLNGNTLCALEKGKWSEWVMLDFGERGEGAVRFFLLSDDKDSEYGLTLAHSAIYPTRGFTYPKSLAADIVENIGPFLSGITRLPGVLGDESLFEEYRYQGLWMARAAKRLLETRGWDLYYQHFHVIDHASHLWLNGADPAGGGYDPAKADYCLAMMRKAYEVSDDVLGEFMKISNDETVFFLLSDHGNSPNRYEVRLWRLLENAGLLTFDPEHMENGRERIVWEKTRAFFMPQRITDIYINLKGKFPQGIVNPGEYEKVQEEIIDTLLDFRNPDGGRVVALALKKRDAQIIGYYGPECGDVVFTLNAGHGSGRPEGKAAINRAVSEANHGPQIPTTRTGFSSNLAGGLIAGPGIRKGYIHDAETQGLWKLIDVVPTIAHMLNFAPPRSSRGGVMHDLFE